MELDKRDIAAVAQSRFWRRRKVTYPLFCGLLVVVLLGLLGIALLDKSLHWVVYFPLGFWVILYGITLFQAEKYQRKSVTEWEHSKELGKGLEV